MEEVDEFQDTDRKINYNLYMDLVDRMRRKSNSQKDLQDKINAMTIFDLRLRARQANNNDRDIYIETIEELSDEINNLTDSPNYNEQVERILFRMWGAMEIFIEQSAVFKTVKRAPVTGKPITREEMEKVRR